MFNALCPSLGRCTDEHYCRCEHLVVEEEFDSDGAERLYDYCVVHEEAFTKLLGTLHTPVGFKPFLNLATLDDIFAYPALFA